MGVIIAVIIWPNGAGFVVIPERYPQEGAQSSRLTVAATRNPATLEDGDGRGWRAGSQGIPSRVRPRAWGPARPGHAEIRPAAGADSGAAGERGPGAVREPA